MGVLLWCRIVFVLFMLKFRVRLFFLMCMCRFLLCRLLLFSMMWLLKFWKGVLSVVSFRFMFLKWMLLVMLLVILVVKCSMLLGLMYLFKVMLMVMMFLLFLMVFSLQKVFKCVRSKCVWKFMVIFGSSRLFIWMVFFIKFFFGLLQRFISLRQFLFKLLLLLVWKCLVKVILCSVLL